MLDLPPLEITLNFPEMSTEVLQREVEARACDRQTCAERAQRRQRVRDAFVSAQAQTAHLTFSERMQLNRPRLCVEEQCALAGVPVSELQAMSNVSFTSYRVTPQEPRLTDSAALHQRLESAGPLTSKAFTSASGGAGTIVAQDLQHDAADTEAQAPQEVASAHAVQGDAQDKETPSPDCANPRPNEGAASDLASSQLVVVPTSLPLFADMHGRHVPSVSTQAGAHPTNRDSSTLLYTCVTPRQQLSCNSTSCSDDCAVALAGNEPGIDQYVETAPARNAKTRAAARATDHVVSSTSMCAFALPLRVCAVHCRACTACSYRYLLQVATCSMRCVWDARTASRSRYQARICW
jgi:hypothetical protein